jgi:DNA invertase Pin-like site-specific DNA recombinase
MGPGRVQNSCPKSTSHNQLQVDALKAAGCYRVFTKTASGAHSDRPTLAQLLDQLHPGDTLVVWPSNPCSSRMTASSASGVCWV